VATTAGLGATPGGEDFETFIGVEKAEEIKGLFTSWIHRIYRKLSCTIPTTFIGTNHSTMLAEDDWRLFTTGPLVDATVTATTTSETSGDTTPATPEFPSPPDQSAGSPDEPVKLAHSTATSNNFLATQSGVPLNLSDHTPGQLDGVPIQSNPSNGLITAPALVTPKSNLAILPPTPDVALSSQALSITESQLVTLRQLCPQTSAKSPNLPSGNDTAARPNVNSPRKLLAGATDEPEWMKKKRTLDYFRCAIKLGHLSNVIEHWYELERLLGFLETVSVSLYVTCPAACS